MSLKSLVQKRQSIRSFEPRPVDDAVVRDILDVIRTSPSAGNLQSYEVVVIRDQETKGALARAAQQEFVAKAPVVLAFVALRKYAAGEFGFRGEQLAIQDTTIAATYAMLAVAEAGLGTTWVGSFEEDEVFPLLGCREGTRPLVLLPVGYPDDSKPPRRGRRSLNEFVREAEGGQN